jgi:hypothetical protein
LGSWVYDNKKIDDVFFTEFMTFIADTENIVFIYENFIEGHNPGLTTITADKIDPSISLLFSVSTQTIGIDYISAAIVTGVEITGDILFIFQVYIFLFQSVLGRD